MKKLFYFAAALLMTACNNEEFTQGVSDSEIRLTTNLVGSRAIQDTQIAEGETVYTWLDKTEPANTSFIKAWKMTAQSDGKLIGEEAKFYPEDYDGTFKVYALHINRDIEKDSDLPTEELTHNVETNQSDDVSYAKSDLLYGIHNGIKKGGTDNILTLYHMLSKIEIKLSKGTGFENTDFSNASVSLLGLKISAQITLSNDGTAESLANQENRRTMITATGESTNNIILKDGENSSAIIVPQTVDASTDFIQVKVGNTTLAHQLKEAKKFESGYKYTYNITVRKSGLKVTTSVAPWETTDEIGGDAVMRPLSGIEGKMKNDNLDRGVIRNAEGAFQAYYIFNPAFTEVTSYVIGATDDKRDLTIETQKVAVTDSEITFTKPLGGISKITLEQGALIFDAEGVQLDANIDANKKFLAAGSHYVVKMNRKDNNKYVGNCNMSTLFKEEMLDRPADFPGPNEQYCGEFVIELNKDNSMFAFTTYPKLYTSYTNTRESLGKDEIRFNWDNGFRMNGTSPMDAEKGQESTTIKNMFESYHDLNIFVPFKADSNDFYIINKSGKGWFLFTR